MPQLVLTKNPEDFERAKKVLLASKPPPVVRSSVKVASGLAGKVKPLSLEGGESEGKTGPEKSSAEGFTTGSISHLAGYEARGKRSVGKFQLLLHSPFFLHKLF